MEYNFDDSLENLIRITGMDTENESDDQNMLIAKSKEYNEVLSEFARTGASEEDITDFVVELIKELDAECPYINKPIKVSGIINRAVRTPSEEGTESWEMSMDAVDDLTAVSLGYAWQRTENKVAIVHSFSLIEDHTFEVLGGIVQRSTIPRAFAELDEVSIEYQHNAAEASKALQAIAGDLIDEIDQAIYNPTSTTEMVQKLGEIAPLEIYNDLPTDLLFDIGSYVHGMGAFDDTVPYEIEIRHSFMTEDEEGESHIVLPDTSQYDGGSKRILGLITGVAFTDSREVMGKMCIVDEGPHFALIVRVVHDELVGGESDYEICVLMKDIGYCESLRDLMRTS